MMCSGFYRNGGKPMDCTATLHVFPQRRYQTIRHFGASACWWAPANGNNSKIDPALRLLFTDCGLGLNALRINIGGSVKDDRSDGKSSCPEARNVYSPLREDGTYDLRRCEGSWNVLQKALKLGTITDITLFFNSPPSTMTKNGMTSSDDSGQEDVFISNLREDCYEAFADYVAEITQRYIHAGIPVRYVSPINEPQWAWNGGQEGCHYTPEELVHAIRLIYRAFEARKKQDPEMAQVRLSLPETAQWWQRPYVHEIYQLLATDPEFTDLDHFCAHSYGTTREQKVDFVKFVRQCGGRTLPLHQTEFGGLHPEYDPTMQMGLELATVLYEDLSILHCESWSWWLGIGSFVYTDGLICCDTEMNTIGFPKRYFVMKQHSRYLKDCTCLHVERENLPDSVLGSAYLTPQGGIVFELINTDTAPQTLCLCGLPTGASAAVIETSDDRSCEECNLICADEPITISPRSVTTLLFSPDTL